MEWYWILLITITILAAIIPFFLAIIKGIKFYEAWLIAFSIWFLPLELIVITVYRLNKILDFLCKHIKAKQKNS